MITYDDFAKIEMRIGTIVSAYPNEKARVPAIVLEIDFGPLGMKKSSAQITHRYNCDMLPGRQVVAVVNMPPRNVAGVESEVLVLGACPDATDVVLLEPGSDVPNGTQIS